MKVLTLTAMYPTADKPNYGAFIKAQVESLERAGIEMTVRPFVGSGPKMYLHAARALRSEIHNGYDLIHAHYSYAGFVARTQFKLPVVVSFMGSDVLGNVGDNFKETPLSLVLLGASARWLAGAVDGVIVKSEEMARKLPAGAQVIPNGVNFSLFKPVDRAEARAKLGMNPDTRFALFAANPAEVRKGYHIAKAAFDQVQAQHPNTPMELRVAQKETQQTLALLMNACDVLMFPSSQEGSPNVVKQALACNMPVLATRVGDIPELFANATHCQICDPDGAAFAGPLARLLMSPVRSNGRVAIAHLDEAAVADQIVALYRDVLARTGARAQAKVSGG
jgi:glycosyltransferase involved in cell wall biosynthesis